MSVEWAGSLIIHQRLRQNINEPSPEKCQSLSYLPVFIIWLDQSLETVCFVCLMRASDWQS